MIHQYSWCDCKDWHAANSFLTNFSASTTMTTFTMSFQQKEKSLLSFIQTFYSTSLFAQSCRGYSPHCNLQVEP